MVALASLVTVVLAVSALGAPAAGAFDLERKLLSPLGPPVSDDYGKSAALSGDTALVGGAGAGPGVVYVYERDQGGADAWGLAKELSASDPEPLAEFGWSAALDGDRALIGAFRDGAGQGAAYLFERDEGGLDNWGQVEKLVASDGTSSDEFGFSVALDGDVAVVGAWDAGVAQAGAAYVYERDAGGPGNWGEAKKLLPSSPAVVRNFGWAVTVSGDTAVVTSGREDTNGEGAAYVFERNAGGPGNWGQAKRLTVPTAQSSAFFGRSTALDADTLVVGALTSDGLLPGSGAAFLFDRDAGGAANWGNVKQLAGSDAHAEAFGSAVAIDGDTVIVAVAEDQERFPRGATYVFERDLGGPDNWGEARKITSSDQSTGNKIALSSDTLVTTTDTNSALGAAYIYYGTDTTCADGPALCNDAWGKALLQVRETVPGKESFKLKLSQGPPLTASDFGTPTSAGGTVYSVCIYDDADVLVGAMRVQRAAGRYQKQGTDYWNALGDKGFRYRDRNRGADGVDTVSVKGGGSSNILVKGLNKANRLQTRLPTGMAAGLSGSSSATVQLHGDDLTQCFGVTLTDITKDTGGFFKAKN